LVQLPFNRCGLQMQKLLFSNLPHPPYARIGLLISLIARDWQRPYYCVRRCQRETVRNAHGVAKEDAVLRSILKCTKNFIAYFIWYTPVDQCQIGRASCRERV